MRGVTGTATRVTGPCYAAMASACARRPLPVRRRRGRGRGPDRRADHGIPRRCYVLAGDATFDLPRRRMAGVMFHAFKGLLPLILAAEGPERDELVGELKAVLRGYLAPIGGR
jgi:hypothetical protein